MKYPTNSGAFNEASKSLCSEHTENHTAINVANVEGSGKHSESAPSSSGGNTELGASPCNTAPANCIPAHNSLISLLLQGVDSLYLSFRGRISYFVFKELLALKDLAKSEKFTDQALAVYHIDGCQFEVMPAGSGRFPVVMSNNAFRISISSVSAQKLPLAQVQIRSSWLLKHGVESVLEDITGLVAHFGEIEGEAQVSRADLHLDFTCAND